MLVEENLYKTLRKLQFSFKQKDIYKKTPRLLYVSQVWDKWNMKFLYKMRRNIIQYIQHYKFTTYFKYGIVGQILNNNLFKRNKNIL